MSLKASELTVGDVHQADLVEDLTRSQIVQYAGSSGDYNPIHTDNKFATEVAGYPGVFAHGMLTMGMTGMMLTNYVGDGRLTKFGVRFTAQVWPGDNLAASAKVSAIRDDNGQQIVDLEITTTNQDGTVVLSGNASAKIDA